MEKQNQAEWPIYSLADYQNSGSLLGLTRAALSQAAGELNCSSAAAEEQQWQQQQNTQPTSDYFTCESSLTAGLPTLRNGANATLAAKNAEKLALGRSANSNSNRRPRKSIKPANAANPNANATAANDSDRSFSSSNESATRKLFWWQLIECGDQREPAEAYRAQVLLLCSSLHKALSPYLTMATGARPGAGGSWRLRGPHSLRQPAGGGRQPLLPMHAVASAAMNDQWPTGAGQQELKSVQKRESRRDQQQLPDLVNYADYSRLRTARGSCSVADERLSPATIRRLSWRRKMVGNDVVGAVRCRTRSPSPRRLVSIGRNPSSGDRPSSFHHERGRQRQSPAVGAGIISQADQGDAHDREGCKKESTQIRKLGRLERWIKESCECQALQNSRARWLRRSSLKRGKYGESLVHILIVNQTNEHLILLVLLLHLWPLLVADVFESCKFKGLGCLHLAIAYSNERLLRYLLELGRKLQQPPDDGSTNDRDAYDCYDNDLQLSPILHGPKLVEQRVTGSLFRSPVSVQSASSVSSSSAQPPNRSPARFTWFQWASSTFSCCLSFSRSLLRCLLFVLVGRRRKVGAARHTCIEDTLGQDTTMTKAMNPAALSSARAAASSAQAKNGTTCAGKSGALAAKFWCDQMDHWPTANGHAHLLLFDKAKGLAGIEQRKPSVDRTGTPTIAGDNSTFDNNEEQQDRGDLGGSSGCLPAYLGETPLAWSVSFGARLMYELLVSVGGADQNAQDLDGNTCLHQVVVNNQIGWTRFLVKSGASDQVKNCSALTPILLSCHLGRYELFNEFVELSAAKFWSYSMIRCCGYPLTGLDSIQVQPAPTAAGSSEIKGIAKSSIVVGDSASPDRHERSAVAVIMESGVSNNEQKARLLSSPVVKKLLEEKWRIYARRRFYRELVSLLTHLILMSLAIELRLTSAETESRSLAVSEGQTIATTATLSSNSNSTAAPSGSPLNLLAGLPTNTTPTTTATIATSSNSSLFQQLATLAGLLWLDRQTLIRHLSELVVVLMSLAQLIRFLTDWLRIGNSFRLLWTYNSLLPNFVAANVLIVACALLRLTDWLICIWPLSVSFGSVGPISAKLAATEDILLTIAAPILWSCLLFFVAAFRVTGPFVAMIRYMILRDLRQFSLIYLVFVTSFAQCLYFVNYKPSSTGPATTTTTTTETQWAFLKKLLLSYVELWLDLFKMTLGVYELQPYRHSSLARFFFLLFIYLIPILFNMLIAMMNNTYSLIISQSERAWSFQWARTLFSLERGLSEEEKSAYFRLYSINMVAPADKSPGKNNRAAAAGDNAESVPKRFVPALMIIKRMSYTRAERRRLIVSYWQKSIRSILDCLGNKKKSRILR